MAGISQDVWPRAAQRCDARQLTFDNQRSFRACDMELARPAFV